MEKCPVDAKVTTCALLVCCQCKRKTDMLLDAKCIDCYLEDAMLDMKFYQSVPISSDEDETDSKFWKGD